jgi:predicted metalloprotease with PDZ domain
MTRSSALALGLLIAISPSVALAQYCVTLNDRPNGGCLETGCELYCALPSARGQSAKLMPGFFVEQKDGRVLVTGVLPNSPAAIAGVRVGDELLEVDSLHVPFDSVAPDWQRGRWHTIQVKRGSVSFTERINSESVQSLVSALPVISNPIKPVSFPSSETSFRVTPFLSGMLVRANRDEFVVEAVLLHSPADRAGVRPGDRLLRINGETVSFLEYSNERRTLNLTLRGHKATKQLSVRFASLPELLESAAAE